MHRHIEGVFNIALDINVIKFSIGKYIDYNERKFVIIDKWYSSFLVETCHFVYLRETCILHKSCVFTVYVYASIQEFSTRAGMILDR